MKQSNFQIIAIAIFIIAAIIGMLVFSGKIQIGKDTSTGSGGTVVVWGTVNIGAIFESIEAFNRENPLYTVKYVQKYSDTFDQELLSALASGTGIQLPQQDH
jgi:ABC-type glycerol-3-phosphate transport system substrate-binding protein